jgi:hypothetical protein
MFSGCELCVVTVMAAIGDRDCLSYAPWGCPSNLKMHSSISTAW